jgi:hypothetical protein
MPAGRQKKRWQSLRLIICPLFDRIICYSLFRSSSSRYCWLCLGAHTHTNARWNKNTVDFPAMNAAATNSPVSWLFSLFTRLGNFVERNTRATYRPRTHQDLHAMIRMTRSVMSRASSSFGHHGFSMRTGNHAHHSLSQNRHAHTTYS